MKRFTKITCYSFVCLFILFALLTITFMLRVEHTVSKTLSDKLKVPVSVKSVDFHWGSFVINGLTIHNPSKSRLPIALQAKTITFQAPYYRYFMPTIHINDITCKDLYVSIEFYNEDKTVGNWTELIENLDSNESFGKSDEEKHLGKGRIVMIKKLLLYNINIDLLFKGQGQTPYKLSPIEKLEFDNVSSQKGLPTEEITEIIVQKMMEQISIMSGIGNMLGSVVTAPAKALFAPFEFLFGGGKKSSSDQSSSENQQANPNGS